MPMQPSSTPAPIPLFWVCAITVTGYSPKIKANVSALWTVISNTTPAPAAGLVNRQPVGARASKPRDGPGPISVPQNGPRGPIGDLLMGRRVA